MEGHPGRSRAGPHAPGRAGAARVNNNTTPNNDILY